MSNAATRRKTQSDIPSERRTGTHRRVNPAPPLVLLVDDAEDSRTLYAQHLESCSVRVEHAVDGEHAIFKILQLRPDVVVMDLAMPVLDGWEAIRQMKAHHVMQAIPVVALTGRSTEESIARAHAAGADAVLTKPCAPTTLHAIVCEVMAKSRSRS